MDTKDMASHILRRNMGVMIAVLKTGRMSAKTAGNEYCIFAKKRNK